MRLHRADARAPIAGLDRDLVAGIEAPAGERARHHGARARDREGAVDEQAGPRRRGRRRSLDHRVERGAQVVEALAADRRDRHDGRPLEHGAVEVLLDLLLGDREGLLVDEVALREGDHAAGHAEHVEDLEVLLGLRLPALVGGHDEHDERRRSDAGQHVADEPLVAGHVDEPDLASARQFAPRVAEVDREAAALLLGPPIGVHAGEPHDQRRLAVVDVACRRHHPMGGRRGRRHVAGVRHLSPRRRGRRPRGRTRSRGPGRAPARRPPYAGRAARGRARRGRTRSGCRPAGEPRRRTGRAP